MTVDTAAPVKPNVNKERTECFRVIMGTLNQGVSTNPIISGPPWDNLCPGDIADIPETKPVGSEPWLQHRYVQTSSTRNCNCVVAGFDCLVFYISAQESSDVQRQLFQS